MFWTKRIASRRERKWFVVFVIAMAVLFGFEAIAFSAGLYQLRTFLKLSLLNYLFLIVMATFIFDLRLKVPRTWSRSAYYYQHSKHRIRKAVLIVWRALVLRFQYLKVWSHWLHFQNYLILPAVLYWGVVLLIFLNPFDQLRKQVFITVGTILLAIVFWFFKTFFVSYNSAMLEVRYLMFSAMILAGFLIFAPTLGLVWYLGLSAWFFILAVMGLTFLLLYQSLFHHSLLRLADNLKYTLLGALFLGMSAYVVTRFWSVNYYTAGTLLAGCLFWYWSLVLQWLQKRLTLKRFGEYTLLFLLILLFVLATTNFHARIG